MAQNGDTSLATAAARGALAGLAGGLLLMLTEQAGRRTILPEGSDTTSTAAQAAKAVASERGTDLSRTQAEAIGGSIQLGWCAALGAVFGMARSRIGTPAVLDALALAGVAYAVTMPKSGVLAKLGVTPPFERQVEQAIIPVASHVAFGVATAAVFEGLTPGA